MKHWTIDKRKGPINDVATVLGDDTEGPKEVVEAEDAEAMLGALREIGAAAPGSHQADPCYGRIRELKGIALAVIEQVGE